MLIISVSAPIYRCLHLASNFFQYCSISIYSTSYSISTLKKKFKAFLSLYFAKINIYSQLILKVLSVIKFISHLSTIEFMLFIILLSSLFIQLFYYLLVFSRVGFYRKKTKTNNSSIPLSVIICAKNEEDNLREFLPLILSQKYSEYEVVVVNDGSQDNTETLLAQLEQTNKHLRHTNIEHNPNFNHGKKLAVSIGIKSAKHKHLVFTDADCYPESDLWLQSIANTYNTTNDIVLGYGKYKTQKGLLNKLVRFDTLMIALQYLGMAMIKKPYMGVGRNMSYKKSLFTNGKGFSSHYHILSGDDDLFINQHANKKNTLVAISQNSFTCSIPPQTFRQWIKQKKRHLSTSYLYKASDKIILGLEPFSKLVFYISLILLIFSHYQLIVLSIYLFRLLIQGIILKLGMIKLNERKILFLLPFFDIILPIFQLFLIKSNKRNKKNITWR